MPDDEYTLARSVFGRAVLGWRLWCKPVLGWSLTLALSTLSGNDSRLPPNNDEGARARIEAFVSKEFRRRLFDEEASVKTEALSVSRLLAVAVLYVVG